MENYKIRCSQIGKVMTNNRKGDGMGETSKTYIEMLVKEQLYGRKKEITSKYLDKGIQVEQQGIDLYNKNFNELGSKNELFFENEYIKGTPDIILTEKIVDIKCSWDFSTFPLFENEIPNKDYFYQLQGYMWLTDKQQAELVYCLIDTPHEIIEAEFKKHCYKNQLDLEDFEMFLEFSKNYLYSDITNEKLLIKKFEIKRDENVIENIKNRVIEVNEYIKTLKF